MTTNRTCRPTISRHAHPMLASALCLAGSAFAQEAPEPTIVWQPAREIATASGRTISAQSGRLSVPQNRSRASSGRIELSLERLSGAAESGAPPIVYLHGGPGGQATHYASDPVMVSYFAQLLEAGDVILLDQRGCGRSKPRLLLQPDSPPPADVFLDRGSIERWLVRASRETIGKYRERGIEIEGYTTTESADDLEDLRLALGAEKLSLLGFSYGTHLGLSALRRHGPRVARAVLVGVEGPDHTLKLPVTFETHWKRLGLLAAQDPNLEGAVPDLEALLHRVLEMLGEEPLRVTIQSPFTGEALDVPVGPAGLLMILAFDLGDVSDVPVFPRLLTSIEQRDPSVLQWFVQKRYPQLRYVPPHLFITDGAAGTTPERRALIEAQAARSRFAKWLGLDFPEVQQLWAVPDAGAVYRSPVLSDVPTLFVSGTYDFNTPPYQAEEVRWGFTHGRHLLIERGGHESWLRIEEVWRQIGLFLGDGDITECEVVLPPLRFVPLEGRDPRIEHPAISGG